VSVRNLEFLFRPGSIALFGADNAPRSIGLVLAQNLFRGEFDGPVMPVHARDTAVQGVLAYKSIADLPLTADLAVIASPPAEIPGLIAELGARGTRAAVVISHDFDAAGQADAGLRQRMLDAAKPRDVRIVGPACLGVMVPASGLNASYAHATVRDGDLAFVSQSGSLMTLMLDWAAARGIGFSLLASLGDIADVDFGDMLDYLAMDADTRAVLLCIDHIAHPRKFVSAARAAARLKPVIVFDARRLEGAGAAAVTDTQKFRRPQVYDAAFRRAGMLPVASLADLVAAAGTVGTGIHVNGDRMAIVANGRGIADVAGNIVLAEGGRLAALAEATLAELDRALPPTWGRRNPVNLFADATAARYRDALGPLLADTGVDAIVAINTPSAVGDTFAAASAVAERLARERKPVAAVWLEEKTRAETRRVFANRRIPLHESPGQAIEALMQLVRYRRNQDMLMETPASVPELFQRDAERARAVVRRAIGEGRDWLSEPEAKQVLAAYGIPVVPAETATTPENAAEVAARIGFPVSIRTSGYAGTGEVSAVSAGIALNRESPEGVEAAARSLLRKHQERHPDVPFPGFTVRANVLADQHHELRLGIAVDASFGPVVLFGQGGDIAQVVQDQAVGLPPLNVNLARRLIAESRVHPLLQGYGDRPAANIDEIAEALVKLSQIAAEIAEIAEVDVNPLLADAQRVIAVAVRIRVLPSDKPADARLAIRPYPSELEKTVRTRDGRVLFLRPIRPEDEPAFHEFVRRQTPEDKRLRFFSHVKELDHRMAARLTQIDYDREMALILLDPQAYAPEILGVMRISADADGARAEYAGAVRSDLKGRGLGRLLLEEIIEYARRRGIGEIWGEVLAENEPMLRLVRSLGFSLKTDPEGRSVIDVSKTLASGGPAIRSRPNGK
jgi:acetyltransferase